MDAPTSKRQYRNPLADYQDQILFFGLFLVGAIAIISLKYFGFNQIIVTAFPICLMFLYAGIALVTRQYRLREDRVGDNLYYLGFLYTLTSLAYALATYATYNSDGSGAKVIIGNFGIAISSTIVGLAGRVLFNQMREDPVEYEREARYSLAEASRALSSQLGDISVDMSNFKRKLAQIVEEGIVDVSNTAKMSLVENVERFSLTVNEVIERIRNAFGVFTDHSVLLNDIASKNVAALQALFERIEKIEASPELITSKIEPVMRKFEEVADEVMRRNRAQTNDLKRVRDMIETATTASEALRKIIAESDTAVTQKMENFARGLDATLVAAGRLTETLNSIASALSNEIAAVNIASTELNQNMTIQRQSITSIRSSVEEDLQIIRQHREAMSILLTESRESVKALQSALVSLSRTLAEQLGGR